jgi:hypothetical protein
MKHLQMGAMGLAVAGLLDRSVDSYTINLTPRLYSLDPGFIDYRRPRANPAGKPKNERRTARNKAARKARMLNRRR